MKEIQVTYNQAMEDYGKVIEKMLDELSMYHNILLEDIRFYYYWTLVPSSDPMESNKHLLLFNERLNYELGKVAIEVYIKTGNYIRGEVVDMLDKPSVVKYQLSRLLVSTMRYEQMTHNDNEVLNSIPSDIEPYEEIEQFLQDEIIRDHAPLEESFTLDDLLDKISKYGYDRLSEDEKKRLDNFSKGDK